MIEASPIDALRALLGPQGLLVTPSDMAAYETGARYDQGRAAFVARPASTAETSAVVAYCVRNGIALVPQSGNTGLVSGSTPDASGQQGVLSLDRLTGIFELDRVNRSVQVGAGLRLSDLNARLEADGLFFPIDLGADPRLGGMIATNTGGSRFLRYGDVRRNTLGLKVVLADEAGTVLELGTGLRKDNTGIDWKQMFIGTSGAFGVITECVLNLEPLPRQTATAFLVPSALDRVPDLLTAMEQALGNDLSAFEGLSKNAVTAALSHVPSLRNPFQAGIVPEFVILAEISRSNLPRAGEQPLDAVMEEVLGAIFEREDALLADAFIGRPQEMWALRHALSEGVKHLGRLIAFDLSFRRGDIMRFLDHMKAEMPKHFADVLICDFGHIGDGGVHFNLVVPKDDPRLRDAGFETALREWVFSVAVEEFHGSFSAEHAIGRKNQAFYDRYTPHDIRRLATDLKAIAAPGPLGSVTF
ncbi:FAD-binding oxidoreductase [Methylovirgula sp. 4M-Z18]|uniref:FAD-binding oxidoreductase n=1 Tax=Methylovirgula sp. 4M-Z18 TaxID=2293567 RepID=UPI000E2E4434|nr:FAD-binding oxidoreductase [Methylovirgula sp. 4M-Z18]RFB75658.1 FAD-binding oxidoreductase [Methylovirgula sp. 4M-Z18]